MQAWHLTFASDGRAALFPGEAPRRLVVQTLARVAGDQLLLFCIVDDHVHVVLLCSDDRVGRLARALLLALRPLAGPVLEPAHVRAVEGRGHLQWLVRYCLRQPIKHRLGVHPALWSGSCFSDLVGARVVEGLAPPLREALPRLRQRDLFDAVGLARERLEPLDDDALRAVPATDLVDAAAFAVAAPPGLADNRPATVAARRAACQLGQLAGYTSPQLARALAVQTNAVSRLRRAPVDDRIHRAVRLLLALQARVRDAPLLVQEPAPLDDAWLP